ncbi:MAG TPA: hypothetical protein V6C96_02460, partial [Vampirovibrionales bacterium]
EIEEDVEFVKATSVEGEFGILENHSPLITKLAENSILEYVKKSKATQIKLTEATCRVSQNKNRSEVTVLATVIQHTS